jgi:hypothetical protein
VLGLSREPQHARATRYRATSIFCRYLEIDLSRLHELLNARLDDFAEFAARIRDALGKG